MSAHTLVITPAHNKQRLPLRGDMSVLMDTAVTNKFTVRFFTTSVEIFQIVSTVFTFRDIAGNLSNTLTIGGKPGLWIDLMFDPLLGTWYITANNLVVQINPQPALRTVILNDTPTLTPPDGATGEIFSIVLHGPTTLAIPVILNPVLGFQYIIFLQQDAVGGRLVNFTSKYKFPGGRAPVLSIAPAQIDLIKVVPIAGGLFLCETISGYSIASLAILNNVKYDLMSTAVAAAVTGDVVWVTRTGNLQEALATLNAPIVLGIAGMPGVNPDLHVDGTIRLSFGKATLNYEQGELYIKNLTMSGAAIPADGNGAAIRVNPSSRYLQLDNVLLTKNENGFLTSTLLDAFKPARDVYSIVVQDSVLDNNGQANGAHQGLTHNVYLQEDQRVYAVRSKFLNSEWGHDFKNRSHQVLLDRCHFEGSKNGRALDSPNGSIVHAVNCYFRKPSYALQSNLVGIGQEGIVVREQQYIFRNCLFENLRSTNYQLSFVNQQGSAIMVYFIDCVFLTNPGVTDVFNVGPIQMVITGGHLGPEDYFGPAGMIPQTYKTDPAAPNGYSPQTVQPVTIYGPDPTLTWFPPTNSPATNPNSPLPATVLVATTATTAYPTAPVPSSDITPPTVALSASSLSVVIPGSVLLTAVAADNVGVQRVEFYRGATLLLSKTSLPFEVTENYVIANNGTIVYTAKAFDAAGNSIVSAAVNVVVAIAVSVPTLDSATNSEYLAAIAAASMGGKRLAAANAIAAALSPDYRLYIYRNGTLIIPMEYTGAIPVANNGTDVYLRAVSPDSASPVVTADLATGNWTFELQGGALYGRKLTGTVGPTGSGCDIILDISPAVGVGIAIDVKIAMPRSLDGLV